MPGSARQEAEQSVIHDDTMSADIKSEFSVSADIPDMFSETHTENSNRHINASQPHTGMKSVIESDNKDWTQEYEQIDMTYISPSQEPSNTQQNSFLDDIRRRIEQVKQ